MAGNTFGDVFRVTTFGESHGAGIGCVIDGVPPGMLLSPEDIQKDLDRRKPGQSEVTTPRKESDTAEILSGVFEGKTTGTPLAILIRNNDQRSQDYNNIQDFFRPGHADFTFLSKFGIRDHRGGGRASGRETAARVAAGAVARKFLAARNISVTAYTFALGGISVPSVDFTEIEKNQVRAPHAAAAEEMVRKIIEARDAGDSVGGIVEAQIIGLPAGLGDPVFDKLEAKLAHAILSIGSIKGIEFGSGFAAAGMYGSQHNDEVVVENGRPSTVHNFAGGVVGGISNGDAVVFRAAVKPTSSIASRQNAVNKNLQVSQIEIKGRHDPCLCPRMVPVIEAMAALVIVDAILIQKTVA